MKKIARLGTESQDYQRVGIKKDIIQQFEDGLRTSGKFGEYEWWYFDAKLEGGYSLVIVFYSQPVTAVSASYAPCVLRVSCVSRNCPKTAFGSRCILGLMRRSD